MTLYIYAATVQRVIDGDTVVLDVDLGFKTWHHGPFRLVGINARELHSPGGLEARDNLMALLPPGTSVGLSSVKPDKYAERYDAKIVMPDGSDLGELLVSTSWAAVWDGRGSPTIPPWPRVAAS